MGKSEWILYVDSKYSDLVIVTIIIVAVIVLLLMRAGRKTKAVGGVKGKKVVKNLKKNGTV